ncbi:MAG: hypothetical protein ACJ796_14150 [Gemmatimonadaceae bacterium]
MRSSQDAILEALLRSQRFLTENQVQLASIVDITTARQRLDNAIAGFTLHAVEQESNRRGGKSETEKQRKLRLALRTQQMAPIAEIARHNLPAVSEFKALRMPSRWTKGTAFLGIARSMLEAAKINKDALIEHGLPADSLDLFQSLLTKLEESGSDRQKSRGLLKASTKALHFEEKEGRSVLKVLNALVTRALDGNVALLGLWDSARTIASPRSVSTATQSTTTSPAPAATPVATTTTPANATTPPSTAA